MKLLVSVFFFLSLFVFSGSLYADDTLAMQSEQTQQNHPTPDRPFDGSDDSEKEKEIDDDVSFSYSLVRYTKSDEIHNNFRETIYTPPYLETPLRPPRS